MSRNRCQAFAGHFASGRKYQREKNLLHPPKIKSKGHYPNPLIMSDKKNITVCRPGAVRELRDEGTQDEGVKAVDNRDQAR